MATTALRTALSVPPGVSEQTTSLVASINSLRKTEAALTALRSQVTSGPPQVQQKLAPIISRYLLPLQGAAQRVNSLLMQVTAEIVDFCGEVAQQTAAAEANAANTALRSIDVQMLTSTLSAQANTVETACKATGSQLIAYRDNVNSAAAQLNSFGEQLAQEDRGLEQKIKATQKKLHDIAHASFWDKIKYGFQALFGHLKQDLERDVAEMRYEELEIEINKRTVASLNQMVTDMGDISSVASALETSWRNLGDSIGALKQDMSGISTTISVSDWKSDLAYVNSDWQNILQIVKKINA